MVSFLLVFTLLFNTINGGNIDCYPSLACTSSSPATCVSNEACTVACNADETFNICKDNVIDANGATDVTVTCTTADATGVCENIQINCETATGNCKLKCTDADGGIICRYATVNCGDNTSTCGLECRSDSGSACNDAILNCGSSSCSSFCRDTDSGKGNPCNGNFQVNVTPTTSSFECTGNHCPSPSPNVPAPFTANPTPQPTAITSPPTDANPNPTVHPTTQPTEIPITSQPSNTPSQQPTTSIPTKTPTATPITSEPTSIPSYNPSKTPTTLTPSESPTIEPSTATPTIATQISSISPSIATDTSHPSQNQTTKSPTSDRQAVETTDDSQQDGGHDLQQNDSESIPGWIYIVAGCSVTLCLLIAGCLLLKRKRKRKKNVDNRNDNYLVDVGHAQIGSMSNVVGDMSQFSYDNKGEGINKNNDTENMDIFSSKPIQNTLLNDNVNHMTTPQDDDDDSPQVEMQEGNLYYDGVSDDNDIVNDIDINIGVATPGNNGHVDNITSGGIDFQQEGTDNDDMDDIDDDNQLVKDIDNIMVIDKATKGSIGVKSDEFVIDDDDNIINDINNPTTLDNNNQNDANTIGFIVGADEEEDDDVLDDIDTIQ